LYDLSDAEAALREHHIENEIIDIYGDEARHEAHSLPGKYDNYREVLVTLPDQYKKGNRDWEYTSHYDERNILGHVRLDDRLIDGKKTLFVEEVQSDWHQHGRDEGYINDEAKNKANLDYELAKKREIDYKNEVAKSLGLPNYESFPNESLRYDWRQQINRNATEKQQEELQRLSGEVHNTYLKTSIGGVPDAPYKKTWHEMLMKQVMDIAAKENYDAIAFTTGKQQNDRYNLAKYIENLTYNPETNQLFGYKKDGYSPVISEKVEPDKLADYVGADVAKRLLQKELTPVNTTSGVEYHQQLSGLDLESGGEPMKKFYDRDIPNFINKYTKKWGMGMKKANLESASKPLTDEQVAESLKKLGYSMEEYYKIPMNDRNPIWDKVIEMNFPGEQVHFVELTDAAKKDIKEKGQPMFAGIGALGGADYLLGSDDQQKTGILKDLMKQKY
jgi:hypothetical protein